MRIKISGLEIFFGYEDLYVKIMLTFMSKFYYLYRNILVFKLCLITK
jgi:hypothetical protein